MYSQHVPLIRDYALESPDHLFRVGFFTLATVNRHLELVPRMLDTFDGKGFTRRSFSERQEYAIHTLYSQRKALYRDLLVWSWNHEYPETVVKTLVESPGLGIVKASFFAQLLGFNVGCLDRHNLRLAGLDENLFKRVPTTTEGLTTRLRVYVDLCQTLGGAEALWDQWCNHVALIRPYAFADGEAVSRLHADTIVRR